MPSSMRGLAEALERFEPVIGLEVHAQLRTASKLFARAPNRFDPDHPNQAVTAYCVALPGQLPVLNERAVEMAVLTGLALGCRINPRSVWARKQYFYPDLPKGYQISQYDAPICEAGTLEIPGHPDGVRRVRIARIHMEEDAGKSTHVHGSPWSLLDFSRAGVPLIEIVTEPDLHSAQEAGQYLRELRSILRTLDVCDGNMEQGSFRCDANVSIRPRGDKTLGARCELKNINSFRFVEQAIEVEILRHARLLEDGGRVRQETRLYDPERRETRPMRSKEEAEDYRYFPDPDLPPLDLSPDWIDELRKKLPELPAARRARWTRDFGLPEEHAQAFSEERSIADFFDGAVGERTELAEPIAHLMKTELLRALKEAPQGVLPSHLRPSDLQTLVGKKHDGQLSSAQVKKLFTQLWKGQASLKTLLEAEGEPIRDRAALTDLVRELLQSHPKEAQKLKDGQKKIAGFFVGQAMRKTQGKADPQTLNELLNEEIGKA